MAFGTEYEYDMDYRITLECSANSEDTLEVAWSPWDSNTVEFWISELDEEGLGLINLNMEQVEELHAKLGEFLERHKSVD